MATNIHIFWEAKAATKTVNHEATQRLYSLGGKNSGSAFNATQNVAMLRTEIQTNVLNNSGILAFITLSQ